MHASLYVWIISASNVSHLQKPLNVLCLLNELGACVFITALWGLNIRRVLKVTVSWGGVMTA